MWAYFGYSHLCTYKHITVNQISPLTFVNTCTLSGLPIYGSPSICMYNNFMINYKKKTLLINKHCILDNFHWKNKCIGSHLFRDSSKCQWEKPQTKCNSLILSTLRHFHLITDRTNWSSEGRPCETHTCEISHYVRCTRLVLCHPSFVCIYLCKQRNLCNYYPSIRVQYLHNIQDVKQTNGPLIQQHT